MPGCAAVRGVKLRLQTGEPMGNRVRCGDYLVQIVVIETDVSLGTDVILGTGQPEIRSHAYRLCRALGHWHCWWAGSLAVKLSAGDCQL